MSRKTWIALACIGLALLSAGAQEKSAADWKWPDVIVSMDTNPTAPTYVL
ncbi:MAG: hypothetical protein HGB17_13745, partial [Syntrophobacteraceae bacterium]|nr:hypothetical protein [Syntrophobacteraceae bacterium]